MTESKKNKKCEECGMVPAKRYTIGDPMGCNLFTMWAKTMCEKCAVEMRKEGVYKVWD